MKLLRSFIPRLSISSSPTKSLIKPFPLNLPSHHFNFPNPQTTKNEQQRRRRPLLQLAKEESKLEKDIVCSILAYEIEKLKPNSGQVKLPIWEWHGHIMFFDKESGYSSEYIYRNYFERVGATKKKMKNDVMKKSIGGDDDDDDDDEKEKEIEKVGNVGLKELIECGESASSQILHRNINAGSTSDKALAEEQIWIQSPMSGFCTRMLI